MISTESYKGVRDFYPEDLYYRNYILDSLSRSAELFGYEQYDASILEPAELYRGKTSDEIVNNQTYTFTDRGDREVTMRPEMTPTVARMIAHKRRELPYPLRWYSVPNMFRYEKPQRGRLREFWQFNADVFGYPGIHGDVEALRLAHSCITNFGASSEMFEIRINDRSVLNSILQKYDLSDEQRRLLMRALDAKDKMSEADFSNSLNEIVGSDAQKLLSDIETIAQRPEFVELFKLLAEAGITNVSIDATMVRGFDYYTGIVFEGYDTHPDNRRAFFGGGRYDNLLTLFGQEPIPTIGFAAGDAPLFNFLETHGLLPAYVPKTKVMLCVIDDGALSHSESIANQLRKSGIPTAVNASLRKLADQFKTAEKLNIPYVIVIGSDDTGENLSLKKLGEPDEKLPLSEIISRLKA
jgi:histidyl-tRNA synthetase